MHSAASGGNVEIIEILKDADADLVHVEDEKGNGVAMFYVVEASLSVYLFAFVRPSVLILVS